MSIPFPQPEYPQPFLPIGGPGPAPGGVPFPSQSYYAGPPSPMSGRATPQGHHYRPRTHSHSSSHGHHHHHHSHSHHRSSSRDHHHHHSHSRSRHHSAPAPPILITHNPEPIQYVNAAPPYAGAQVYQPAAPFQQQQQSYLAQPYSAAPYSAQPYSAAPYSAPMVQFQYSAPNYSAGQAPPSPYYNPAQRIPRSPRISQPDRGILLHKHRPQQHVSIQEPGRTRKHSFMHPLFKYSRCTGRRKAVCVGINYTGTSNALNGCVNDAKNMYHFLVDHYHYPPSSILYLTDNARDPRARPTRETLINAMHWLVEGAQPDDALFFHYSGHGGQTRDLDGDEVDGYDEVIFPLDYKSAGVITDDVMHSVMVKPLPPGCRLTALFDSCHSGSVLDLPYLYHSNGRIKGSDVTRRFKEIKSTPADVITWSGCKDSQTSADTSQNGVAVGAMSYAFTKVLKRNPQISYQDLLRGVREILNKKYSQKPQLSSSHRIDTSLRFVM